MKQRYWKFIPNPLLSLVVKIKVSELLFLNMPKCICLLLSCFDSVKQFPGISQPMVNWTDFYHLDFVKQLTVISLSMVNWIDYLVSIMIYWLLSYKPMFGCKNITFINRKLYTCFLLSPEIVSEQIRKFDCLSGNITGQTLN